MDHREAIDEDGHIIAVTVPGTFVLTDRILVDDLKKIVMDVFLVDQGDVLGGAVIPLQDLDEIFLDLPGLLDNMIIRIRQRILEEPVPLRIRENIAVQNLQLFPKVRYQLDLGMDRKIFIALFREHTDEFPFQFSLTLIAVGPGLHRLIFRDNGIFCCLGDDIEIRHVATFFLMPSP